MKKLALITAVIAAMTTVSAADLSSDDNKITYAIGLEMAQTVKTNVSPVVDIDKEVLFEAISDALDGKEPQLNEEEIAGVIKQFSELRQAKAKEDLEIAVEKNKEEAEKFLADNKAKDGVIVTESGLQYRVITEGKGPKPTIDDVVKVDYVGTLPDGTEFDSSIKRGEPAEFPLKGVIAGWGEGVQLMSVGSKYEFVIPAALAYGERGPGVIGPERALKFEVELLEIVKQENQEAPASN